jgi:hypothetical protein
LTGPTRIGEDRAVEGQLIVKIAALAIGAAIAVALLWHAGELHYIGCVRAAEARWEPVIERTRPNPFTKPNPLNPTHLRVPAKPKDLNQSARQSAVGGCSRLP